MVFGNVIYNLTPTSSGTTGGIWLDNNVDDVMITGNEVYGNTNAGTGIFYGIRINNANCNENTVVGNHFRQNEENYSDAGTDTYAASNNII